MRREGKGGGSWVREGKVKGMESGSMGQRGVGGAGRAEGGASGAGGGGGGPGHALGPFKVS